LSRSFRSPGLILNKRDDLSLWLQYLDKFRVKHWDPSEKLLAWPIGSQFSDFLRHCSSHITSNAACRQHGHNS
jgi:hypothetical protein